MLAGSEIVSGRRPTEVGKGSKPKSWQASRMVIRSSMKYENVSCSFQRGGTSEQPNYS